MSQYVTLELKRGTLLEWANANPTLAPGEPGFELDTGNMKIGDGTTGWNYLPYMNAKTNPVTNAVSLGVQTTGQGSGAVAIGVSSGQTNQGTNSVAVGSQSGQTNQGANSVAIGSESGQTNQGSASLAIGYLAGNTGQGFYSLAIGSEAGNTGQGQNCVAIGLQAGRLRQGAYSVAIGSEAGEHNQGGYSTAIGYLAGQTGQLYNSVAIGSYAGQTNQLQNSVAIGFEAGYTGQGANSIAIGNQAGYNTQPANTIILDASGSAVNGVYGQTGSFYVAPIRSDPTKTVPLLYDPTTHEIVQGASGIMGPTGPTGTGLLSGITFCGLNFINTGSGDFGYPSGVYYINIPITGVSETSNVQVTPIAKSGGMYEGIVAALNTRLICVETLNNYLTIWVSSNPISDDFGFAWNVIKF